MLRAVMANEADRGKRERLEQRAQRAHRRAPEPDLPRRDAGSAGRDARARRAELPRALRALRLRARRARRRSAARCSTSTERLFEDAGRPALPRPRSASALDEASAGTSRASSARRDWDSAFPAERDAAGARGRRSPTSASTCARSGTSSSTSSSAPKKTPRAFCAPIEVPDRVVLVIQPIGGAGRLARALPRGRPHGALRAHLAATCRWRSKRLGDNAVTEGWAMLLEHLTDEPALAHAAARLPAAGRVRGRGRDRPPLLRAPLRAKLLYELEFHAADDPTTMRPRYVELLADALKIAAEPDGLPGRHGRRLLRDLVPALVGVRGAAPRLPAREVRQRLVRPARGRRSLLRELWSLGQRYDAPTSCSRTSPARGSRWSRSPTASARCCPRAAASPPTASPQPVCTVLA